MRVVFFGSSDFSLPTLRTLAESAHHQLVGVVAQPDRPSGRNRQIQPGLVHQAALNSGIPILLPEKIGSPEAVAKLIEWSPDVIVVASFGQYIPTRVLEIPSNGVINVHPSLLPKYRGAAPLQWSIASGETISGVTIFYVVKKMDAGDIILQEQHPIFPDENAVMLSERFSVIGAGLAVRALDLIRDGNAPSVPQVEAMATYAPKMLKADGQIDWRLPALTIHNRIRGFQPWPGCYFRHQNKMIKVFRSEVVPGSGKPGEVRDVGSAGPVIMTGDNALRLIELQPEGKKSMSGSAFLCGHSWSVGDILDGMIDLSRKDVV
jgi:methionyl-tRNA formyltransferase